MSIPKNLQSAAVPLVAPQKKHPGRKRTTALRAALEEADQSLHKAAALIDGYTKADQKTSEYDGYTAALSSLIGPLYVTRRALAGAYEILASIEGQMPTNGEEE